MECDHGWTDAVVAALGRSLGIPKLVSAPCPHCAVTEQENADSLAGVCPTCKRVRTCGFECSYRDGKITPRPYQPESKKDENEFEVRRLRAELEVARRQDRDMKEREIDQIKAVAASASVLLRELEDHRRHAQLCAFHPKNKDTWVRAIDSDHYSALLYDKLLTSNQERESHRIARVILRERVEGLEREQASLRALFVSKYRMIEAMRVAVGQIQAHIEAGPGHPELTAATIACSELLNPLNVAHGKFDASEKFSWGCYCVPGGGGKHYDPRCEGKAPALQPAKGPLSPERWTLMMAIAVVKKEDRYRVHQPLIVNGLGEHGGKFIQVDTLAINDEFPGSRISPLAPGEIERQSRALLDNIIDAAIKVDEEEMARKQEITSVVPIQPDNSIPCSSCQRGDDCGVHEQKPRPPGPPNPPPPPPGRRYA